MGFLISSSTSLSSNSFQQEAIKAMTPEENEDELNGSLYDSDVEVSKVINEGNSLHPVSKIF